MVTQYLPQQTNSATRTLEITEDNSNKNLLKKQPLNVYLFSKIHRNRIY